MATDEEIELSGQDLAHLVERETLSYVIGAWLRRLNCKECKEAMVQEGLPNNFTAQMTFEGASMITPTDIVISSFASRLRPILDHLHKHFFVKNIIKLTLMKFRFKSDFPACTQLHANSLLQFYSRALIRNLCKQRNTEVTASQSKTAKKFKKLNL